MRIIYLDPKSPFKDKFRSDFIWGMICWGIRELHSGKVLSEFIDSYRSGEFVKVSSAFPYRNDETKKLYFPKPLSHPLDMNRIFDEMTPAPSKSVKKNYLARLKRFKKSASLLEEKIFFRFLSGELDETQLFLDEKLWADARSAGFTEQTFSFNTIDRLTNNTSTDAGNFFEKDFLVSRNSGLFFLMDGPEDLISKADAALRLLSHTGFGGDSTTGKNLFRITSEDYSIPSPANPDAFLTLSLYRPVQSELGEFERHTDKMWYETVTRKGKAGGNFRRVDNFWKDSLLMFREGSVFPLTGAKNYGANTEMKRFQEIMGHPVYHYGISFNISMKLKV